MTELLETWLEWVTDLAGPPLGQAVRGLLVFLTSGFAAVGLVVLAGLVWFALSASLRREERARCFLRLIEAGLRNGQSAEHTVLSLAATGVRELGRHFRTIVAWVGSGQSVGTAAAEVPRFLPDQVGAMLRVGEAIGDVARVLPVCRASLTTGPSVARRRLDSVMVLLFVSPAGPFLVWVISTFVLPKFRNLAEDMSIAAMDQMERWFAATEVMSIVTIAFWIAAWLLTPGRGGLEWIVRLIFPRASWLDRIHYHLPWRRRRLLRDFSALLGSLLDAGLPEQRAVTLAAEGTGSRHFQRQADRMMARLASGQPLPDALSTLDASGEFAWRFRNACASPDASARFTGALRGWHETLDARAFRQEQWVSQLMSSGFVFLNGAMVACAAIGVFSFLSKLVHSLTW